MKFGLSRHYWNEYVFEAYVNYQVDMVLLEGFPDIPLSRPLLEESKARRGGLWRNGPQAGA
jgi:molybdopterin-guanine dinucleotide biosynthesis protein